MANRTDLTTTQDAGVQSWESATFDVYADLAEEIEDLDQYAKAENTLAGYCSDWFQFSSWARGRGVDLPLCDEEGRVHLPQSVPPVLVKAYIVDRREDLKWRTIARHLTAIKHFHTEALVPSPTDHPEVKRTLSGLKRRHQYTKRQAGALRLPDLRGVLPDGDDLKDIRDRAMLVFGFWSALRRSELVRMNVEHLQWADKGAVLLVPYSKTDQEGNGAKVPVNHQHSTSCPVKGCAGHSPCPVCELRGWLKVAGIKSGPIWRGVDRHGNLSDKPLSAPSVSEILKARIEEAGANPAKYSAHSLRAGFVSSMGDHGVPSAAIRAVTRHKSEAMMDGYDRPDELLRDSAGAYLAESSPVEHHERRAQEIADRG